MDDTMIYCAQSISPQRSWRLVSFSLSCSSPNRPLRKPKTRRACPLPFGVRVVRSCGRKARRIAANIARLPELLRKE